MKSHDNETIKPCCQKENDLVSSRDPVCGMDVAEADNSLHHEFQGTDYYFCSSHCLKAFTKNPISYLSDQRSTNKTSSNNRPVVFGTIGVGVLLVIFFGIVTLANGSLSSALQEFKRIWYWILILASGFGFQLGLFTYLKQRIAEKTTAVTAEVAASGTVTTGSMVACCAHGLVNVLPLVGVSAAAAFLATYQTPLILIGVFSNLVGITIMLGIIQKHSLLPQNAFGHFVAGHSMKKFRNGLIAVGVVVVALTFFSTAAQSATYAGVVEQDTVITLKAKTDDQKRVKVKVAPQEIRFGEPVLFKLTFDTHSVDLSFDPIAISTLELDNNIALRPEKWDGAAPGGHHRSGTLIFKSIPKETKSLKLTLRNVAGVPERTFIWNLTSE
ncbi:MAG: YHS domain-containing protein [Thermodesulfobacteriota bacterium]